MTNPKCEHCHGWLEVRESFEVPVLVCTKCGETDRRDFAEVAQQIRKESGLVR